MNIGPRLLSRDGVFADRAKELEALRHTLDSAPGVKSIFSIEPHRKGGHVVSMEIGQGSLDAFIAHLDAEGWTDAL